MLKIRNLYAYYGSVTALAGVSRVREGEIVALIGANGAGKTTLLNAICGLVRRLGEITFQGRSLMQVPTENLVSLGIAQVPEGRQLFAPMTVAENLELGAYRRFGRDAKSEIAQDLEKIYLLFPKLQERLDQPAGTLSGGEQQMLAIARALMARPKLLLLDEPSLGLAPLVVEVILATLTRLREEGVTVLLVEQNARGALKIVDRAYVLETGRIILSGNAQELRPTAKLPGPIWVGTTRNSPKGGEARVRQPQFEAMDREEMELLQLERLQSTLTRAYRQVKFYRRQFDRYGLTSEAIRDLNDLRRLPFTTREDLSESYPYGLFAVPLRDIVRIVSSPGTTERPLVVGYTSQDLKLWQELLARLYTAAGVTQDDIVQFILPPGLANWRRDLMAGAEHLGASVIPAATLNFAKELMVMRDYRTSLLITTASLARHLLTVMARLEVGVAELGLKRALLVAAPLPSRVRLEGKVRVEILPKV